MNATADTLPHALAARLREAASLDDVMRDPGGALAELFACDRFTLFAVDAEGDYLVSHARGADGAPRDVKVAIGPHSIAGHAALERTAVNVADAWDEAELARIGPGLRFPRGVDQRTGYRTRQVLAVPVTVPENPPENVAAHLPAHVPAAVPAPRALLGVIQLVNTRDGLPFPAGAAAAAARLGEAIAPLFPARRREAEGKRAPPGPTSAAPARPVPTAPADAVLAVPAGGEGARLLARIVADAHRLGAAAIHVEPGTDGAAAVRLRRDGALVPHGILAATQAAVLLRHLEAIGGMAGTVPGKPRQATVEGRAHGLPDVMLQVAMFPSTAGQDVVLRLARPGGPAPLARLGMAPADLGHLHALLDQPGGLLLVAGPADSGRSTTLHALLGLLNGAQRKICTAEDPITLAQPGLRQVRVGQDGPDFAAALEAFRHADADVIMVDALRDGAATGLAIEAALAGRKVFGALAARGAPQAALRLLEMAADPFGAAEALGGVLAQRLVRCLCTACRQPYHAGAAEIDLLLTEYCAELPPAGDDTARQRVLAGWRTRHGGGRFTLFRAVGCAACDGGYRGRTGLFELMIVGERTGRLLAQRPAPARLAAAALDDGMRTLKMDGIEKVLAGLTDIRMVRAACAR